MAKRKKKSAYRNRKTPDYYSKWSAKSAYNQKYYTRQSGYAMYNGGSGYVYVVSR